jgi:hypothetical protein
MQVLVIEVGWNKYKFLQTLTGRDIRLIIGHALYHTGTHQQSFQKPYLMLNINF